MSSTNDADIQAQLQALRESYAMRLPGKLEEISTLWHTISSGEWETDRVEVLHRLTHSLAGSGSTFGFPELGEISRSVELLLKGWLHNRLEPDEEQRRYVANLLVALHKSATAGCSDKIADNAIDVIERDRAETSEQPLIYLVEDDASLAEELALQLDHFGYRIKVFSSTERVDSAVATQPPDAFIVDINLPEGAMAGTDLLHGIQNRHGMDLPAIVISSHNDFTTRLAAVRAGGEAYFVKPLEISALIDRLDQLTRREVDAPYRILAIDDDHALAAHYALVLRQAGMEVRTVTQAEDVMATLVDFKPELILMDVYMPSCSGLELAKLIRQQEAYLGIPIVFLSSETNLEKQYTAMRMGGDDFLTKPIQDQHLVTSVAVRAERARMLGALMVQDSLTGLLKHTMIKEQLAQELARAKRTKSALSFAMIDIDKFKDVNDNYGHMMGDRVIKSLARLLQQRLRKCDTVGRYGGEEFAVVLPNCDLPSALKVIETIRTDFSELHYQHEDKQFSTTFSAGIASFPTHESAEGINQAADEALYTSKREGRNRVTLDGPIKYRG
ncbi:diguanylate cyclase [Pseudomonadota bacterium]